MKMRSEKLRPSAEDADEVEAVAAMAVGRQTWSDLTLWRRSGFKLAGTEPC